MRDRVLLYAVVISVFVHLGAVCIVGGTSASRTNASALPVPQRLINVDVIEGPFESRTDTPAPAIEIEPPESVQSATRPRVERADERTPPSTIRPPTREPRGKTDPKPGANTNDPPGNPGGLLNTGTRSANGDLPGGARNGNTPPGWVPGAMNGTGTGSGNSPGTGNPDPISNATAGTNPLPSPGPPPAPATVDVQVCKASGWVPGKHCKSTRTKSFIEGKQPAGSCDQCKPPHVSTLADRKNPELAKDAQPRIPDSLDEGLSLSVSVEYWVEKDGSVTGPRIVKSSGHKRLDRAVAYAAPKWKYKPAVQNGVPRRVKMKRSFQINT